MFIHLGENTVVPKKEVIAILNAQLMNKSDINKEFMKLAEEDGFTSNITDKAVLKSFIITTNKIFLSPISPATLKKRSIKKEKNKIYSKTSRGQQ
ncbi:extracellular matrix regulator RemB [Phosphitispora sp. TUW77]|uniref:extracellular matrix regulator RemB n=1 Tax=Phosphitispora sp. TUW77 TaxID=3152361 RepID=UPI003AB8416E